MHGPSWCDAREEGRSHLIFNTNEENVRELSTPQVVCASFPTRLRMIYRYSIIVRVTATAIPSTTDNKIYRNEAEGEFYTILPQYIGA